MVRLIAVAILVTIFCFWPFGIIAIIKAASVNTKWARGDREGAYRAARSARTWTLTALATWLALVVGTILFASLMWTIVN